MKTLLHLIIALTLGLQSLRAQNPGAAKVATARTEANKLAKDGNWKSAMEQFRKILVAPANAGEALAKDFDKTMECLGQLNKWDEFDDLAESTAAAHPNDWRLLARVGAHYRHSTNWGTLIENKFKRGQHGAGKHLNASARDRVRALQLYQQALSAIQPTDDKGAVSDFYREFQSILIQRESWELQVATDLAVLPDYDEHQGRGGWGRYQMPGADRGAPVDELGNPVFHKTPESWQTAATDGQRWRWVLKLWRELGPDFAHEADWTFASFLQDEFDVATMASYSRPMEDESERALSILDVHTLSEKETTAKLASGVKRFALPDEYNFLAIFSRVGEQSSGTRAYLAYQQLATSFENRRQFPRAAECWIKAHAADSKQQGMTRYEQIVKNWCRFDGSKVQTAGEGAKVGFVFRNGDSAHFTARKIDFKRLLADLKDYIASNPADLDGQRINIGNLGYAILEKDFAKYIGQEVAKWDVALQPREKHWDRRIEVATPLQTAGAYWLEGKIRDGNKVGVLVWLTDTALVQRSGKDGTEYYVVDSVTGQPVPNATVELFGYRQEWIQEKKQQGKRSYNVLSKRMAEFADANGMFLLKHSEQNQNYQWIVSATSDQGRFAHLGWSGLWYNRQGGDAWDQTKIFIMTDRPVYRPGQPVKFKAWVRRARYDDKSERSEFAGQKWTVEIYDGKGEKTYDKQFECDEYGGLSGELELGEEAALGNYQMQIFRKPDERFQQNGSFRVEEYKKPEFEVIVEAPKDPVALGEKITASVTAKYYFGAPVVNAKVKYKVQRSGHDARWYPIRPWDWLYSPGYWWFCGDYSWYPGWEKWGCRAPVAWWWGAQPAPPELILENEIPIGPDGTAKLEFDTALAKELHGDEDHRYEITVEVTDESRRTIFGKGQVLVAREPFKVHVWTDRGHYDVGQPMEIGIKAQTLDQKGVKGTGKLRLLKIGYNEKGEPQEKEVSSQDIATTDDGSVTQKMSASEGGQYRISASITDTKGHTIEGGYVLFIRGNGQDGREFRFNALELIPEKAEYVPGEDLRVQINTEAADSAVFLFVRAGADAAAATKILKIAGKSTTEVIKIAQGDMPNFFIEAFTVRQGQVHKAVREIVVPPIKRILNLEVLANQEKFKPRDTANLQVKLTDLEGKPFVGTTVLTVYDKSLEYISGGSNVPEIRQYFWKWRRQFHQSIRDNLDLGFGSLSVPRDSTGMSQLGIFGNAEMAWGGGLRGYSRTRMNGLSLAKEKGQRQMQFGSVAPMAMAATATGGLPEELSARMDSDGLADKLALGDAGGEPGGPGGAETLPQVMIRTNFADAIHWSASVQTDANGVAKIEVPLPDNLTTWKIKSWGLGQGTVVGEGSTEIITSKDLILRQQAPRFFVEKDEVVLSANVHNYLPADKNVRVSLELIGGTVELLPGEAAEKAIQLASQKEIRCDWRVKVVKEGSILVRMKALTDADSDAMEMTYPVYVHGMLKTDSFSGVIRPETNSGSIEINVPAERRPDQSRLEVRYSPSIATAIVDALPYLADYSYGCTEQTLNRFLPTVLARKTLQDLGLNLADIQQKRTNLNPQEIGNDEERAKQWKNRLREHPVFNEARFNKMVKQGLAKLSAMQNRDGGWGWFSGEREESYPHTTAVVVHGLLAAKQSGLPLFQDVLENGVNWLKSHQAGEVAKIQLYAKTKGKKGKSAADHLDAFVYMVLAESSAKNEAMRDFLYRDRNGLSVYAKCCFGYGLALQQEKEKRDMLLQNIEQFLIQDAENQTARLEVRNGGFWWWWYGSEIETQAFYLKLLCKVDPKSAKASGVVKFLVNNRKNATYWNSTRDTAYCVEALNDYLGATKEGGNDVTVEILLDGVVKKTVEIKKDSLFTYDNVFLLEGAAVPAGKHRIEVRKKGEGPIYYNAYLTNFTLEDRITRAGLEVKIDRKYYKLTERKDAKALVSGTRGQAVTQKILKYDREEIKDGQEMKSGDLVEVELILDSKNDYEYLLFEDLKPAGFESVEVRSGYDYSSGMSIYREFRDERVAHFARVLPLGKHSFTYRLKAEIPGKFSALPAKISAMYAPELRGNSDEMKLGVKD